MLRDPWGGGFRIDKVSSGTVYSKNKPLRVGVRVGFIIDSVFGNLDNLLVRAPDLWLKCYEIESRQERRENFLLQNQFWEC